MQETSTLTKVIKIDFNFEGDKSQPLVDLLAEKTQLSKMKIKKALNAGACWLKKKGQGKLLRHRRADYLLEKKDYIKFCYDEKILALPAVSEAVQVFKNSNYGIWIKEEGVLSQGSEFGDHASIERYLQKLNRNLFLVHRLDRETRGLILFALNKNAAKLFSELWQSNQITKIYKAVVKGEIGQKHFFIESKLDDKEAKSEVFVIKTSEHKTLIEVKLHTGRFHQIRRHLESIGHPVIGDPLYGKNNKGEKLQLEAVKLEFKDPFDGKQKVFEIEPKVLTLI